MSVCVLWKEVCSCVLVSEQSSDHWQLRLCSVQGGHGGGAEGCVALLLVGFDHVQLSSAVVLALSL